jgi:hypothetical protein
MSFENIVDNESNKLTKQFEDIIGSNYNEYIDNNDKYIIEISDENEKIINLFNNKRKLLTAKYQILGIFDKKCNFFIWAKYLPLINKSLIKIMKNIKSSNDEIKDIVSKNKYKDVEFLEIIMYYLSNNMFIIDEYNIKMFLKYCIYISKCKGILINKNDNKYTYYLIVDIIGT